MKVMRTADCNFLFRERRDVASWPTVHKSLSEQIEITVASGAFVIPQFVETLVSVGIIEIFCIILQEDGR